MPAFPARLPFDHYQWVPEPGKDARGNAKGSLSTTPVPRKAIAYYPSKSQEPISAQAVARSVTELTVLVRDPKLFGERDEVEIQGVRFQVMSDEMGGDWRNGPWPRYNRMFGGQFKALRVG